MPALLLALLALQEPTLEEVLDRMDRAAAASRGASFRARREGRSPVLASVDRDGVVRCLEDTLEFRLDADGLLRTEDLSGEEDDLGFDRPAALSLVRERLQAPVHGEPPVSYDLQGTLLRALAPRRALAFETQLRLVGRRTWAGRPHFLLLSRLNRIRPLYYFGNGRNPVAGGGAALFWVDATDFRLSRFLARQFWSDPEFDREDEIVLEDWRDGIPTRIRERSGAASPPFRDHAVERSPLPPPPPSGLAARHARDPHLDALLERSPDDPELLLSKALALDRRRPTGPFAGNAPDAEVTRLLSRIDGDSASSRNLLRLLIGLGRRAEVEALAERLARDPAARFDASRAFHFLGKTDPALALLPPVAGPRREALLAFRTRILAESGAVAAVLSEIAAEPPDSQAGRALWYAPRESLPDHLDRAVRAHPGSVLLHKLRILHRTDAGPFDLFCRAAADAPAHAEVRSSFRYGLLRRLHSDKPTGTAEFAREKAAVLKALDGEGAEAALVRGLLHTRLGEREDALRELRAATDGLPACPDHTSFTNVAPHLLQPLSELGDAALFERAAQTVIAEIRRRGFSATLALHGLETWVLYCMKPGRQLRMARDFKGIPGLEGLLTSDYTNLKLSRDLRQQAAAILEDGVAATPEDPDLACWYETMVDRDERGRDFWRADRVEILERAREKSPRHAGVLLELARHYRLRGDARAARKALEDLGDRGVVLAEQQRRDGDPDAARATLRAIDFDDGARRPWEHWIAADTWERLGDPKQALACLERLRDAGYRPHLRMRRLGDDVDALRCLNRAIAEGYDLDVWDPYRRRGWVRPAAGPSDAELRLRRDELRRKIGLETLIDRLAPAPLTPDASRQARAALEQLGSGSPAEREEAGAALRKIGPGAAPLLKPALRSDDADLRARALELALEWADPR